jgi:eukaryotic-like serine/threonine-protein kinase
MTEPNEPKTRPRNEELVTQAPSRTETTPGQSSGGTGPADRRAFADGEIVARRYRIVSFLAQGGMGEVYEAEDLDLGGHVALKTIRPHKLEAGKSSDRAVERFRREIQLARKVTHPNVCRIFDIGYHRPPDGPDAAANEILFLTMELLRGETLARFLRRRGPMSEAEALPLVRQMAEALTAAHRVGIVHRDFKSPNVILVRSNEQGAASGERRAGAEPEAVGEGSRETLRAVVTDFGLARSSLERSAGVITTEGAVLGTPEYMAPEQIQGKEATAATDVYSLGLVMYEMLTGVLPFESGSSIAAVLARLAEPAPSPRAFAPRLDPEWEAVILRCLDRDPARRYPNAARVIEALSAGRAASGGRRLVPPARIALAAGLLLAAVAGGAFLAGRSGLVSSPPARRSVAVLGFKNLSGRPEAAWLSIALAEMLGTELGTAGADGKAAFRVVSGESVARLEPELRLAEADSLAPETLYRIRRSLGADLVVVGSFVELGEKAGGQVRVDLRLQDTGEGHTLASVAETGTEAELFQMVARAGEKLRGALGLGTAPAETLSDRRASLPSNAAATRLYAEGLASMRGADFSTARARLEQAIAADPRFPLAHSALAEVWLDLGDQSKAREEAKLAFDWSSGLSREERLLVEGRYREAGGEWDRAVEVYLALWEFFPDQPDYGMRLARAERRAGRLHGALGTLQAVRRLPLTAAEEARSRSEEQEICGQLGLKKDCAESAARPGPTSAHGGA